MAHRVSHYVLVSGIAKITVPQRGTQFRKLSNVTYSNIQSCIGKALLVAIIDMNT